VKGVYVIRNNVTGHEYVGCSVDITKRFQNHRRDLRKGRHHSTFLQRSWDKHGQAAFTFEPVATLVHGELVDLERGIADDRCPAFNTMRADLDNGGWRHTERTRSAQRARAAALWKDPTYLANMAPVLEARRQEKELNDQCRAIRARLAVLKQHIEQCHVSYNGETLHKDEWCERLGITRKTALKRMKGTGCDWVALISAATPNRRRQVKMLTHNGRTQSLTAWAEEYGLQYTTLYQRLSRGMDAGEALNTTTDRSKNVTRYKCGGEMLTVAEIAERADMSQEAVRRRVRAGDSFDELPKRERPKTAVYTVGEMSHTLKEWAEALGVPIKRLRYLTRSEDPNQKIAVLTKLANRERTGA
jgi:hypothetical protein